MRSSVSSFEMLIMWFIGIILAATSISVAVIYKDNSPLLFIQYFVLFVIILLAMWGTWVRNKKEYVEQGEYPMNIGETIYNVVDHLFTSLFIFSILVLVIPVVGIVDIPREQLYILTPFLLLIGGLSVIAFSITYLLFLPKKEIGIKSNNRESKYQNVIWVLTKVGMAGSFAIIIIIQD